MHGVRVFFRTRRREVRIEAGGLGLRALGMPWRTSIRPTYLRLTVPTFTRAPMSIRLPSALFAAPASGAEFAAFSTVSPTIPTKRQRQRDAGGEFRAPEHVDRRDIGSDSPTMSPPATNRRPDGRVTERGSEAPPAPA